MLPFDSSLYGFCCLCIHEFSASYASVSIRILFLREMSFEELADFGVRVISRSTGRISNTIYIYASCVLCEWLLDQKHRFFIQLRRDCIL